jgi:thiosulfate/3-mercaptopyruvate sulfurtransferase
MPFTTLIDDDELARLQAARAPLLVLDCSFELSDPQAGRRAYAAGHRPGAIYVHVDEDLSGEKTGRNGRHPLPDREAFARAMAQLGVGDDVQVVAYDNAGGMYAARLWWMLRWLGHSAVAVLDGGIAAWKAANRPLSTAPAEPRVAGSFTLKPSLVDTIQFTQLAGAIHDRELLVVDARGADRFRGENETMDPVGGHIPNARNRPFRDNLDDGGRFKPPQQLRKEFVALLGGHPPRTVVSQCGSGVTACHNLLALEVGGLSGAMLYPGSWSEWCAQPGAPVATGA